MDILEARKKAKVIEDEQKGKQEKTVAKEKKKPKEKATLSSKALPKKQKKKKSTPAEIPSPIKPEPSEEIEPTKEDLFEDLSFGEDLPEIRESAPILLEQKEEKQLPSEEGKEVPSAPLTEKEKEVKEKKPVEKISPSPEELVLTPSEDKDFLEIIKEGLVEQLGAPTEEKLVEFLSFELGKEVYAIPLTGIQQIIKLRPITFVPRAPKSVIGIISLRGMIIPVIDLHLRLGLLPSERSRSNRIIIINLDGKLCGCLVDHIRQVVRIPEDSIEPRPAVFGGMETEPVRGIGRFKDQMIILLNIEQLINLTETVEQQRSAR